MAGVVALINVGALAVFAIGVWLIKHREKLLGSILVVLSLGMALGFWTIFFLAPEPL